MADAEHAAAQRTRTVRRRGAADATRVSRSPRRWFRPVSPYSSASGIGLRDGRAPRRRMSSAPYLLPSPYSSAASHRRASGGLHSGTQAQHIGCLGYPMEIQRATTPTSRNHQSDLTLEFSESLIR